MAGTTGTHGCQTVCLSWFPGFNGVHQGLLGFAEACWRSRGPLCPLCPLCVKRQGAESR